MVATVGSWASLHVIMCGLGSMAIASFRDFQRLFVANKVSSQKSKNNSTLIQILSGMVVNCNRCGYGAMLSRIIYLSYTYICFIAYSMESSIY